MHNMLHDDDVPVAPVSDDSPCVIKRVPSKRKRKHMGKDEFSCSSKSSLIISKEDRRHRYGDSNEYPSGDIPNDCKTSAEDVETRAKNVSFSLHESFKQSTKGAIYSLTFSEPLIDYFVDNDTNVSKTSRLLATCSNRNLVMYRITTETAVPVADTTAPLPSLDNSANSGMTSPTIHKKRNINGSKYTTRLQYCYVDTDIKEEYYACAFAGRVKHHSSSSNQNNQFICVGGKNGRILVIDYALHRVVKTLSGHGGNIHDLQSCPTDEWLILSASNDYTCRLWNMRAIHDSPIAIFGGHDGHFDGVNSVSWHVSGVRFVSGGIDNAIKIWEMTDHVRNAIVSSNNFTDSILDSKEKIDQADWIATVVVQFPIFSTNRVHAHCVDCVEFLGDLIVSKSTEHLIQLWYPSIKRETSPFGDLLHPPGSDVVLLHTFRYYDGDLWFVRFAIQLELKLLAVGNRCGTVTVWRICDDHHRSVFKPIRHLNINRECTIRCVRFSPDGTMLFASTDDGSIYHWIVTLE